MSENYLLSLILILFSCIAIFKVIHFSNTNKNINALLFRIYSVLLFIFCVSYAFEMASQTLELMKFFHAIKIFALSFMPGIIFLIFFDAVGMLKKVKKYHYFLVFIIPLISIILRLTANCHTMYFYNFSIKSQGPLYYLSHDKGFWFYVFSAYLAGFLVLSFIAMLKGSPKNKKNKFPLFFLLSMIFLAVISVYIKMADNNSTVIFLIPFTVPLFSFILSANYINYKLFDTIPLAYQKAFDWSDNCLLILNTDLILVDYNAAAEKAIPLLTEKMLSENISDFLDYDGRIKKSVLTDSECRLRIINNYSVRHYRVSNSFFLDNAGKQTGYLVSLIDITSLVEAVTELTELASIDALTRVHTRRYFVQRAAIEFTRAKRHAQPLSFIILDLDFFKNINDEFGHIAGDAMLKKIAEICHSKIRSIDLLGRFGGEEFIILLPETDIESAIFVAERIRKTIEKTEFVFETRKMSMTVSLGVTGADKITNEDFDVFLKYADRALYRAKDNGRNRVEHGVCFEEVAK